MDEDPQMKKQKEIQRKYLEYQIAEQQIKQFQQQLEKLEAQTAEVNAVENSIEEMSKADTGDDLLVPVSGGIFFSASVKDTKKFLVNVGAGVVVEKDAAGTKALIEEQARELEKYKEQVVQQLAEHLTNYQELEAELKKLIED